MPVSRLCSAIEWRSENSLLGSRSFPPFLSLDIPATQVGENSEMRTQKPAA